MQTNIIMKDELRAEVEAASGGKQTIIRTAKGQPSYFNILERSDLPEHPAFLVNGVEKSELFLGTYQAVIRDGEAVSLPGEDPSVNINFDQARAACLASGSGHHLMTNLEWALIALISSANGIDVRGNTNYGKSHSHPEEKGILAKGSSRILTGSGPDSWRHDGTPFGIADMTGNVWEWVDGLKLVSGEIVMPQDNDFNLPEAEWPGTGVFVDLVNDEPIISKKVTKTGQNGRYFKDVAATEGFEVPEFIKQALLCPNEASSALPGYYWANNCEDFEAVPFRGGGWNNASNCGLAALSLNNQRSSVYSIIGFRPAFIE